MSNYEVTVCSPEIKTLGEYTSLLESPAFQFQGKEEEFLKVEDEEGNSNKNLIYLQYNDWELEENKDKTASKLLLKTGTKLLIPTSKINTVATLTDGIEVVSSNFKAFKASNLVKLQSDTKYVQKHKPINGEFTGVSKDYYPYLSIQIWCKSLSITDKLEGGLLDVTPFIVACNTTVGKNGGQFNLQFPPTPCTIFKDGSQNFLGWIWETKEGVEMFAGPSGKVEYFSQTELFERINDTDWVGTPDLIRTQFYFHNIIKSNDLVFIKFEELELEENRENTSLKRSVVTDLAGGVYDMIGLVDSNQQSVDPNTMEVTITVSGRDLIKLFIEDGTYFYNLENISGQFRVAGEAARESELMRRLVGDNTLYYLNLYQNTSIKHVLQFIIQQLSTIRIADDSVFQGWGTYGGKDRRNYRIKSEDKGIEKQNRLQELEGIKTTSITNFDVLILKTAPTYHTQNKDISLIVWNVLYSFLTGLRTQKKRKEGNLGSKTETLGWSEYVLSYSSPFNTTENLDENEIPYLLTMLNLGEGIYSKVANPEISSMLGMVDEYIDFENSIKDNPQQTFSTGLAKGVWQIVKLVIDEGITGRRIVDSSMSSANGSLLNFIRKVCQEPFVEFLTDTYGDQFFLIARKPPFDRKSIKSILLGEVTFDMDLESKKTIYNVEEAESYIKATIIDVEIEDVLKEDLQMNDGEVYSWYKFAPQNVYAGGGNILPTSYTPALFFEDYAKIWGSKPLELVHNYNPYYPLVNEEGVPDVARFETQAIEDLKYVVECNSYLPFTRKGQLTINGDRRIKRGDFIRYKSTGEIFYVDLVTQSHSISDSSIDRITTLQVSRGMVEIYIYGGEVVFDKDGKGWYPSYFDIINTNIEIQTRQYGEKEIEKEELITNPDGTQTKRKYKEKVPQYIGLDLEKSLGVIKVNKPIFDFFVKGLQFEASLLKENPNGFTLPVINMNISKK